MQADLDSASVSFEYTRLRPILWVATIVASFKELPSSKSLGLLYGRYTAH